MRADGHDWLMLRFDFTYVQKYIEKFSTCRFSRLTTVEEEYVLKFYSLNDRLAGYFWANSSAPCIEQLVINKLTSGKINNAFAAKKCRYSITHGARGREGEG